MWALTYWAEAVTKRGGRVPLSVQLFDSLELGYKRMLSGQLQLKQPPIVASCCISVVKSAQKQYTMRTVWIFCFKMTIAGQAAS